MSFRSYSAYKESGVSWLGDVPSHWKVGRLKHLLRIRGGQDYKAVESVEPTDFPVIGSGGQFTYATDYLYDGESVLLGRKGTIDKPLYVRGKFWTVDTMFYTEVLPETDGRYAYYLATTIPFALYSTNTALPSMSQFDLSNHELPLPSVGEQCQIARFLDHETAKIDALIQEQERLIDLLQEKRQAVISHAVTKGLDPDVPRKDSGVEWLGEVPAHWDVAAINKITEKITNGYVGPTRDILVKDGVPYIQATHIKNGRVNFDNAYFVTREWSNKMAKSILAEDDVLIVQTGAGTGDIGVVSAAESGYNCHALILLRTIKSIVKGQYLGALLQSHFGQSVLFSIRTGGMHPHLNCGQVKYVKVPVPPEGEQEAIAHYIEKIRVKSDSLVQSTKVAIDLLKERRSALISAAVTGKIDVRSWQPPADESAFDAEVRQAGAEATA